MEHYSWKTGVVLSELLVKSPEIPSHVARFFITYKNIKIANYKKALKVAIDRTILVCLPACLSVCQSLCLLVGLSVCLPVSLSICLSVCLPTCLSVWLSISLSARQLVCLPVAWSVCLSVCLSVSLSVYLSSYRFSNSNQITNLLSQVVTHNTGSLAENQTFLCFWFFCISAFSFWVPVEF